MADADLGSAMLRVLEKIEHNTALPWRTLIWQSLLRGAAFTLGGVLVIAFAGWALSALGVIPGLSHITKPVQSALQQSGGP